jgi:hypothetical protein
MNVKFKKKFQVQIYFMFAVREKSVSSSLDRDIILIVLII